MKTLLESPESFAAYATIDGCYFAIGQMYKELKRIKPDNVVMSDDIAKTIIRLLNAVIKNKKTIDADYSKDKEFLAKVKKAIKDRVPVTPAR